MNDDSKNRSNLPDKKIKLHYFPDIPLDDAVVNPTPSSAKNSFKRVHFEILGCPCPQPRESIDESGADDSSATAGIEEQAYRKGFDEGQKAAIESQREQVESAVKGLEQAIVQIQDLRNEI